MVKGYPPFLDAVKDDDKTGQRIGPPPAESGVENEPEQDGAS